MTILPCKSHLEKLQNSPIRCCFLTTILSEQNQCSTAFLIGEGRGRNSECCCCWRCECSSSRRIFHTSSGWQEFLDQLCIRAPLPIYRITSSPKGPSTTEFLQEVALEVHSQKIALIDNPGFHSSLMKMPWKVLLIDTDYKYLFRVNVNENSHSYCFSS